MGTKNVSNQREQNVSRPRVACLRARATRPTLTLKAPTKSKLWVSVGYRLARRVSPKERMAVSRESECCSEKQTNLTGLERERSRFVVGVRARLNLDPTRKTLVTYLKRTLLSLSVNPVERRAMQSSCAPPSSLFSCPLSFHPPNPTIYTGFRAKCAYLGSLDRLGKHSLHCTSTR